MIPVDFEKALRTKKLDREGSHALSTLALCVLFGIILWGLTVINDLLSDDRFYHILYLMVVVPSVIAAMWFVANKKIRELDMVTIPSPFSTEVNKKIITEYLKNGEFNIDYFEGDNLIATRDLYPSMTREMQLTIIFIPGAILVNVIGNESSVAGMINNRSWDTGFIFLADTGVIKNIKWEVKMWGKTKEEYLEERIKEL